MSATKDDPLRNAIKVRLEFTSANGQRLTVTPSPGDAGDADPRRAGVTSNAQVDAKANGTVRVVARTYTLSGTLVGEPMPIEVKATQAGTIGWLIAIAAGIVLIGTSALRIRQVAKERSRAAADDAPSPPAGDEPHPAQVVPPSSQTDRGDAPRDPESLDV